jgi:hypothetical protein
MLLECELSFDENIFKEYFQTEVHGIPAKKRQIICGTDAEGTGGCGTKWFALELLEDQVLGSAGKKR